MGMAEFWGKVKAEHSTQNDIVFVSKIEEKITIRIQASGVEDDSWFRQFYTEYQGKSVDNYAVRCISIEKGKENEKATTKPIILVIRPTIFSQIVGMLVEEMDLLSPAEGFPITIKKEGTGLNTRYNVMIVPKSFSTEGYEQKDIDEAVKNLTKPKEKKENSFGKAQAEKVTEEPIVLVEDADDDIPF